MPSKEAGPNLKQEYFEEEEYVKDEVKQEFQNTMAYYPAWFCCINYKPQGTLCIVNYWLYSHPSQQ